MSHYQANAGPDLMQLKGELVRQYPQLDGKIWYDKDQANPSVDGMREGVRDHEYFLAYLTDGYLLRPFCRKEIRWALHYRKKIVLLWKRAGNGNVGRFNDFFAATKHSVWIPGEGEDGSGAEDGGGSDLQAIFADAAINYYTEEPFHAASMATLCVRLGVEKVKTHAICNRYNFNVDQLPPRSVLWAFGKSGELQVKYIQDQLHVFAKALTSESYGRLDRQSVCNATAVILIQ